VFAPESVAVIGASRRPGTVGRAIWDNIRSAGYSGKLYAVNPHARQIDGEPCLAAPADLPEHVDLAVIAVPAGAVLDAAEQCGRRGVRAVVVITSGLDDATRAYLLMTCHRQGMRLIGPNCFGVAVPSIGLDATFAAAHPQAGVAGLVMQSGGLGFATAEQLSRLGIGISSFASVGDKLDVSSNDMLMWWEQDGVTRLAVLYIESFGNPRKFARTARRIAASMPVLTVEAGRSEAGQRAAASHTAAVATPLVSREALFQQAGVIVVPDFSDLIETAALLAELLPGPYTSAVNAASTNGKGGPCDRLVATASERPYGSRGERHERLQGDRDHRNKQHFVGGRCSGGDQDCGCDAPRSAGGRSRQAGHSPGRGRSDHLSHQAPALLQVRSRALISGQLRTAPAA
jgi:acyl-CoA synthetase (NDP forming)